MALTSGQRPPGKVFNALYFNIRYFRWEIRRYKMLIFLKARMGERRGVYRILMRKPEGKRPLGRPRRRWEIILRCIFRKWDVGVWTGSSWLRIGTGGGHL